MTDALRTPYVTTLRQVAALVVELRAARCDDQADAVTRLHDALAKVALQHLASEGVLPDPSTPLAEQAGLRVIEGGKR